MEGIHIECQGHLGHRSGFHRSTHRWLHPSHGDEDDGEAAGRHHAWKTVASRTLQIPPCCKDIDQAINSDSKTTATRFALGSCTYTASATIKPQNGDEIVGVAGTVAKRPVRGSYPSNLRSTIVASPGLDQ